MVDALTWLLAVELLGILAFPICFVLFRRLPDRGITLAKPLALVLFSYVLWLSGLTQLIPNTRLTIIVILVLGAAVGGLLFRVTAHRVMEFLKEEWRTLVVAEALVPGIFLPVAGYNFRKPGHQRYRKAHGFRLHERGPPEPVLPARGPVAGLVTPSVGTTSATS